ncbi:MAG: orotate phosphoribosyltransferase [Lachnospiraceae bacterium]|nr:orotate phosphoribosyltransferase [Lachnospiraceae bacterium]
MEDEIKISHHINNKIKMSVLPGHFVTSHSHISHYFDMTMLKIRQSDAKEVARTIAGQYSYSTIVDTIVCMDGCEVIGAFLADELKQNGIMSFNKHETIYVVTPEINSSNQIIFRDNTKPAITNKHVLLLLATATTGKTVSAALDCIHYYGGHVAGISALFSATKEVEGYEVHSIFSQVDVPEYETYAAHDCPLCKSGVKIDAMVNNFGYSII